MRARFTVVAALMVALGACDLLVSPESLTGGAEPSAADAGATDASLTDAAALDADAAAAADILGLVAYWSFDEGSGAVARDQSGFHNDAVLQAGASWGAGHRGTALVVDGKTGYAFVSESPSLDLTTELTISSWLNLDEVPYDQRFVEKKYTYGMKLNGRSPQIEGAGAYAVMSSTMPPGEWHHVAFTFARGEVHAYLDGHAVEILNAFDAGTTFEDWDAGLVIGGATETEALASGRIDELRIYDRALTPQEIATIAR